MLATSASGGSEAPSIVNDNNMRLLFEIQKKVGNSHSNLNFGCVCCMVLMFLLIVKVDDLRANYSGSTVALADICLKPLSTDCATQSVLQVMILYCLLSSLL